MSEAKRAYDILRGYVNQEWDRIRSVDALSAERELQQAMNPSVARADYSSPEVIILDQKEKARRVLGVTESASFDEIRKSFERLNKRSSPGNFPEGSEEARRAQDIHRQIHIAYSVLTEGVDSTEKRFRSLEIE